MPAISRLLPWALSALALSLWVSGCSSGSRSSDAAQTPTGSGSAYPASLVALGHSGLTGYDSDPQQPETDVRDNSWATGTNPAVDSIYQRIVALNPAAKDHVANFAVDGSDVNSLPDQEMQAAAVTPTPELVIIQSIDNDIQCDGTDPQNYGPYRRKLTAVMDSITKDLPAAKVFFVSQWADAKEYDRAVTKIDPNHITGTGPCDTINAETGKLDPKREAYLQHVVDHYFGIITAVCAQYPTCSTDQGAMQKMKLTKGDLAAGLDHLSVAGHRKMAALAWHALYG